MTENLPASTHDGKRSSIWAVSPQPRLSPPFRRLLWGVRETKNPAPRNTRYYSLLAKEVWRNFREHRVCELRRIPIPRTRVNRPRRGGGTARHGREALYRHVLMYTSPA